MMSSRTITQIYTSWNYTQISPSMLVSFKYQFHSHSRSLYHPLPQLSPQTYIRNEGSYMTNKKSPIEADFQRQKRLMSDEHATW